MYPRRELIRLAGHKAALQRTISLQRLPCIAAATELASPFAWVDRALGVWRQLSPVARIVGLPVGFLIGQTVSPRLKVLRVALRWGPTILSAAGTLGAALRSRSATRKR